MDVRYQNRLASLIYNFLVRTAWLDRFRLSSGIWKSTWMKSCDYFSGPVMTTIHGVRAIMNYGYTYPVNTRMFRSYNNPLIELVYQCYRVKEAPLTMIDVGAAIGDTMLLLYSNCSNMIGKFYCIDGDPEFFAYLRQNLAHIKEGTLLLALLSSDEGVEKELIRTHTGTASSQGVQLIRSTTLDSLVLSCGEPKIDVLKIDADGFDGKVLTGARKILCSHQPAVIFEWHPILSQNTGNSWTDHFDILDDCGYTTFIFFTKFGEFSHFMGGYDRNAIAKLAELCLHDILAPDWHYDVIALPRESSIPPVPLAELVFAQSKRSRS